MDEIIQISREKLLDWHEGLGYAFDDVDLDYESDEARDSVRAVYDEVTELLIKNGIDINAEMKKRGCHAEGA